jgi:hypothetical protein
MSQMDDELLLVHGTVQFRAVSNTTPEMVSVRHIPWKAVEDLHGIALSAELDLPVAKGNQALRALGF